MNINTDDDCRTILHDIETLQKLSKDTENTENTEEIQRLSEKIQNALLDDESI